MQAGLEHREGSPQLLLFTGISLTLAAPPQGEDTHLLPHSTSPHVGQTSGIAMPVLPGKGHVNVMELCLSSSETKGP